MERITDQNMLKEQYTRPDNLKARITIHRRFSRNPYSWYAWVCERLGLGANERVLELGSGPGSLWLEGRRYLGRQAQVWLSDLSNGMVAECRSNLGADPRFRFLQCNAQSIPLESESCERVVANHMLYHVSDLQRAAREIYRVLRPDGWLVAATNGERHLAELHVLVRQVYGAFPLASDATRRFGLENGPGMLKECFDEVSLEEFEDALWVTEAGPLVDYVRSMWTAPQEQEVIQALQIRFEDEIEKKGGIFIQKSSGIIKAVKARRG